MAGGAEYRQKGHDWRGELGQGAVNRKMSLSRDLNHCLAPCGIPNNFLPAGQRHLPPVMLQWTTSSPVDNLLLLLISLTQESDAADKQWVCCCRRNFQKYLFNKAKKLIV